MKCGPRVQRRAQVAQLVEQWTENPRVGCSSQPLGTIFLISSIKHKVVRHIDSDLHQFSKKLVTLVSFPRFFFRSFRCYLADGFCIGRENKLTME
jgi:hypothetical protein